MEALVGPWVAMHAWGFMHVDDGREMNGERMVGWVMKSSGRNGY